MKHPRILPIGTPDQPQGPVPVEPMPAHRPGPLGDRIELLVLALLGGVLIVRGCWPW